jgi:hypothetical protein
MESRFSDKTSPEGLKRGVDPYQMRGRARTNVFMENSLRVFFCTEKDLGNCQPSLCKPCTIHMQIVAP